MASRATADELPAGDFGSWLRDLRAARARGTATNVPCGSCTGCCTSAYFIHVAPDETDTLAHIPHRLLFPAPGLPPGHQVLGYDARGHCPMLKDGGCSIYAHRPRICREYDCRVFPAAGITDAGGEAKAAVSRQLLRWRFRHPTPADRAAHEAVRAAAAFLVEHADAFGDGVVPRSPTQLAALAIDAHPLFLAEPRPSEDDLVAAITELASPG